jgi:hypothetical protein
MPPLGGVQTTFRVHIRTRQALGVQGHVLRGYEAHLMRLGAPAVGCIQDTGPSFANARTAPGQPVIIVLDPGQMMVGQWCRGTFKGRLSYYEEFACPPRGVCHPPSGFPAHRRTVARLSFRVK